MLVLAIDTTSLVSSVALVSQKSLIGEITLKTHKTHSERLMPHIVDLLEKAEISKEDLTAVAVSIGPGSFTGLRIGLATAKALAFALKIEIIGVPTLAAMAFGCPSPGILLAPIFDAKKGNVYHALYKWKKGEMLEIQAPRVISIEKVISEHSRASEPVMFMGEAAELYNDRIISGGDNLLLAPPQVIMPRAANVGLLGIKLIVGGITNDAMTLEPLYIRISEAEELWRRKNGEILYEYMYTQNETGGYPGDIKH